MTDIYLNLAGIVFKIQGNLYDYFLYRVREYVCKKVDNPDVTITYNESEKIKIPECKTIRTVGFRVFEETEDKYINYDILKDDTYSALMEISKDKKSVDLYLYDVEDLGGASLSIRFFNMVGEVLKYILIGYDGLCIHSSSLSLNGLGILFSAPSGTGKSTHTRLWQKVYDGVTIVNDDMPALRNIDGVWHLCGTPWSGKTEINKNMRVPLKAAVFLERGKKNEIDPIGIPECVFKIAGQTTMPAYKEMTEKVMKNISSLVKTVGIYRLKCTISEEAPVLVATKTGIINE